MRLAHISDLHVLDLAGSRLRDFLNKRMTGGLTLLLRRSKAHPVEVVAAAVEDLKEQGVDHVVVTGDLTNLSLGSEYDRATALLRELGGRAEVSVVPGNHDVYTRESVGRFERACAEWLPEDLAATDWPWLKHVGDGEVALIGVNTAVPTPWLMANGRVGGEQLKRLASLLQRDDVRDRMKVVLLHHPLLDDPEHRLYWMRKLHDAPALCEVLSAGGVDLVLHGHNHIRHRTDVQGMEVRTAASTSNVGASGPASRAWAGYLVYEIDSASKEVQVAHRRVYDSDSGRFMAAPVPAG